MNKGQELPISTIIIIMLAVVVAAIGIIYIISTSGKGFDVTNNFFNTGGNMANNASVQAGQTPPSGSSPQCLELGRVCNSDSDCCKPGNSQVMCFSTSFGDYQSSPPVKRCSTCVSGGSFCTSSSQCCASTPKLTCLNLVNGITPTTDTQCG